MEFLTLQDVPKYHRSAISIQDCGLPQKPASQMDSAERMKVGVVLNPIMQASFPFIFDSTPPWLQSDISATSETLSQEHSSHSPLGGSERNAVAGKKRARTAPTPDRHMRGFCALLEAAKRRSSEDGCALKRPRTLPTPESTPDSYSPAMLTEGHLNQSSTPPKMATLPGFDEIAKYADHNVEEQAPEKGASPARISYWQTSANSTERPTFNDPFVGAPGLRLTQPMRPPSATGNYTTQNEMKPSFLHSRPPPTYEHRRSSVRSEYEPRMPTLPPMMPQTQTALHGSNPMASRLPGQLLPAPLPVPSHDARRHSEAPYAGYDQYRQRPLWGSEAAAYPCYPPRHDSSVGGPPDPRWPSYVPAAYAYAVDPAQAQATNDSYQRKRRGNLPKEATSQLKQWFQDHSDSPYPNEEQKARLAATTELSIAQISNWFINARRRNPGREAREAARLRNNAHQ